MSQEGEDVDVRQRLATPAGVVLRPVLERRVRTALDEGHVQLIAPAGFGKTIALLQVAHGWEHARAALQANPESADPGALLDGIVTAVTAGLPGVGAAFAERLSRTAEPVHPFEAVRALGHELQALLVEPLLITVDEGEHIADAPGAAAVLQAFAEAAGPAVRLAVASRRPLLDGHFATTLGPSDLAFTPGECAAVLDAAGARLPTADTVAAVMRSTEGWPLGVGLLARQPADARKTWRPGPELFSELVQQLLGRLEPEMTRGLIIASLPAEGLDEQLAGAMGLPDGFLADVANRGLPLFPTPAQQLRFHPLMREALLARFATDLDRDEQATVRRLLAAALVAAGREQEAIDHWIELEDWDAAAEAIGRQAPRLTRVAPGVVGRWLERLPPETPEPPALLLARGQIALTSGDIDEADRALGAAGVAFGLSGDATMEWTTRIMRWAGLHLAGRLDDMWPLVEDLDGPAIEAGGIPALVMATYGASMYAGIGDFVRADQLVALAASHPLWPMVAPLDAPREAYVHAPAGNMNGVLSKMTLLAGRLEKSDPMYQLPLIHASMAMALEELGADDAAAQRWERSAEEAEQDGTQVMHATTCRVMGGLVHARNGRLIEADLSLARVEGRELAGWWNSYTEQLRAWIALGRGDPAAAVEACVRALEHMKGAPMVHEIWTAESVAEVLVMAGDTPRASVLINETIERLNAAFPGPTGRCWRARLMLIQAWMAHGTGDIDRAWDLMSGAWEEAGEAVAQVVRRRRRQAEALVGPALEHGAIEPEAAVATLATALPGGAGLVRFVAHPTARVRAAAIGPAVASGHPEAAGALPALLEDADERVAAAARSALERLRDAPPPLLLSVLGAFSARRGGHALEWSRPAPARLVRYLLARPGRAATADDLFAVFWPGAEMTVARRNLHVTVSRARAVLDLPGMTNAVLESAQNVYRLCLNPWDVVDADDFEIAATAALAASTGDRLPRLQHAAGLWTGEPLSEDRYEDWANDWRNTLIDNYRTVLRALKAEQERVKNTVGALDVSRRLVTLDPLDERAQQDLIVALAREGLRGHALRQFLEFRRALVSQLGIEPSEETSRLHARVLAGEAI